MKIKTDNDFLMATNGSTLAALLPVNITNREQAYRTAAWILIMGDVLPLENDENVGLTFDDVCDRILNL